MAMTERLRRWARPALFLVQNVLSLLGAVLTTSSAVTMLGYWVFEYVRGDSPHPYSGILFLLVLPGFFLAGLVLIPLGSWLRWRRLRSRGELPRLYPQINLRDPLIQRTAALVGVLTLINAGLLGSASYHAVEYMDSTTFCGQACHGVMAPEHTAYLNSPHSRVACVECHIGPGAPWFVRSKLSGVRQVFAVTLETHSRPIPTPVKHLRPARETCEQCHWPQMFHGDKFLVRKKYADDEQNTESTTVLVLKIGGQDSRGRLGIHGRHLDDVERITYIATDARRQVIPWVSYVDDDGKTIEYVSSEVAVSPEELAAGERRKMDCMDCHNRPSHTFELPERALDQALAAGIVSRELPYVKKKGVELLREDYPDRESALARIPEALTAYYRETYPQIYRERRALVETAAQRVADIYRVNAFPEMKVTWGTYPNNIGHEDYLGCFRCHDESHESSDGRTISQDCDSCHTILAMEESDSKILSDLGLN